MSGKVFCVGFHKTGTTSLGKALKVLGYKVTGPNGVNDPEIEKKARALVFDLVKKYDAFQDNPWPLFYEELDRELPESKFILTVRDEDSWIKSQVSHFGYSETPMRRWIYGVGCPKGNEEVYLDRYRSHNAEVQAYFAGRENDFLVMDLAAGDGWEKLCGLLGQDIPDSPFPHANKGSDRDASVEGSVLNNKIRAWFRSIKG